MTLDLIQTRESIESIVPDDTSQKKYEVPKTEMGYVPAFKPIQGVGEKVFDISVVHAAPNELLTTLTGELQANAKESAINMIRSLSEITEAGNPKAEWILDMQRSISNTVTVFTAQEWLKRLDKRHSTSQTHPIRHEDAQYKQNYPRSAEDLDAQALDIMYPPQMLHEAIADIRTLTGNAENTLWVEDALKMAALFREQFQYSLDLAYILENGAVNRELTNEEIIQVMHQFDYLVVEGVSQRYLNDFIGMGLEKDQADKNISGLITTFVEGLKVLEAYNDAVHREESEDKPTLSRTAAHLQTLGSFGRFEKVVEDMYIKTQDLITRYNTQTHVEPGNIPHGGGGMELINNALERHDSLQITPKFVREEIERISAGEMLLPEEMDETNTFKFIGSGVEITTSKHVAETDGKLEVYGKLSGISAAVLAHNLGVVFMEHEFSVYTSNAGPASFTWGQELVKHGTELERKLERYVTDPETVKILSVLHAMTKASENAISVEEMLRLAVVLLGRRFWSENMNDFDRLSSVSPYNVPFENSEDPRAHFHIAIDLLELAIDSYIKKEPKHGVTTTVEARKLASEEFLNAIEFMRMSDKQYVLKDRSVFYAPVAPRILGLGKETDPRNRLKTPGHLL